ncbi:hypothetical protein L7F22_058533 [Adiantum nelumboides]|nr:hypothetical protein [Adiantum nelumboides]
MRLVTPASCEEVFACKVLDLTDSQTIELLIRVARVLLGVLRAYVEQVELASLTLDSSLSIAGHVQRSQFEWKWLFALVFGQNMVASPCFESIPGHMEMKAMKHQRLGAWEPKHQILLSCLMTITTKLPILAADFGLLRMAMCFSELAGMGLFGSALPAMSNLPGS